MILSWCLSLVLLFKCDKEWLFLLDFSVHYCRNIGFYFQRNLLTRVCTISRSFDYFSLWKLVHLTIYIGQNNIPFQHSTTTWHPTIHVNTTWRTVRRHSDLETLLVPAELADVACLCGDVTVGEVTALVLETVTFLHRPPEESLNMTHVTHWVNVMS